MEGWYPTQCSNMRVGYYRQPQLARPFQEFGGTFLKLLLAAATRRDPAAGRGDRTGVAAGDPAATGPGTP
eukprot:753576-Hanusia_phi.AAC.1